LWRQIIADATGIKVLNMSSDEASSWVPESQQLLLPDGSFIQGSRRQHGSS